MRKAAILDSKSKATQPEHTLLHHNSDAPISSLPNEILAMIFEVGVLLDQKPLLRFEIVVSHVTQHWRDVALATPRLWTNILWLDSSVVSHGNGRAIAYFQRSKSAPIDLRIAGGIYDLPSELGQLIDDHIGRCRRLFIRAVDQNWLSRLLKCASGSAPLLEAIDLDCYGNLQFHKEFPCNAPSLRSVRLIAAEARNLPFCPPIFGSVTSLHLISLRIVNAASHRALRDVLTAMPWLIQLELSLELRYATFPLPPLLIIIPNLSVLHLDTRLTPELFTVILLSIHAASLHTMSLKGWDIAQRTVDGSWGESLAMRGPSQFPLLQHLSLVATAGGIPDIGVFAAAFPHIVHLTYCYCLTPRYSHNIEGLLDAFLDDDPTIAWPNLQTIAIGKSVRIPDALRLRELLLMRSRWGHPIRKLWLPRAMFAKEEIMVELQGNVEIEEYVDKCSTLFPAW